MDNAATTFVVDAASAGTDARSAVKSIVLVHGAFVDGSGWIGVYNILKQQGFDVTIVQNPTQSLADDVAITKRAIAAAAGQVILVGHSYGGAIISQAGTDPKVAGLVYVAAFMPDAGESVETLISTPVPGVTPPPILPPADGFLFLDNRKFADAFAADIPHGDAVFMADSQVPWGVEALSAKVTVPAWRSKPSWYLVAADDRMIPPVAQRQMAARAGAHVEEASGSHAIYVSTPEIVAALIVKAAQDAGS